MTQEQTTAVGQSEEIQNMESVALEKQQQIFPKSEWKSLLTCIGAFFGLFITVGFSNAFGVFLQYLHGHQLSHEAESVIAWIGSIQIFLMFIAAAPAGILMDRIGPTPLLAVGSAGVLVGVFMMSLSHEYYQLFLAQGVLLGSSMGLVTIPSVAAVNKNFVKARGIAGGFTIAGSSMGGVVFPILMDQLLNHRGWSFGASVRLAGYIMIPIAVLSTALVRLPPPMQNDSKEVLDGGDDGTSGGSAKPTKTKKDLSIIRKPAFIFFALSFTICNLSLFTPFFYVTTYAVSLGHSVSFAFYLTSALNGASLFGRIGLGIIADKLGVFNLLSIATLLSAIICFCWTAVTSVAGLLVWSLVYGFVCGACLSLSLQAAGSLSTAETQGSVVGITFGCGAITGLVGSPIAGALVPKGWLGFSLFAGCSLLIGSVFAMLARASLSRELKKKL